MSTPLPTIAHITAPSTANIPSTCDYSLLWRSYRTESSMTSVATSLLTLCMTVGCFMTAMTASWTPRLNRVSTRRCCTFMQQVSHCLYALTLTSRHNHAVQTSRLTRCHVWSMAVLLPTTHLCVNLEMQSPRHINHCNIYWLLILESSTFVLSVWRIGYFPIIVVICICVHWGPSIESRLYAISLFQTIMLTGFYTICLSGVVLVLCLPMLSLTIVLCVLEHVFFSLLDRLTTSTNGIMQRTLNNALQHIASQSWIKALYTCS